MGTGRRGRASPRQERRRTTSIGPATIRRLLYGGWPLLVLGMVAGFVGGLLLADWAPGRRADAPAAIEPLSPATEAPTPETPAPPATVTGLPATEPSGPESPVPSGDPERTAPPSQAVPRQAQRPPQPAAPDPAAPAWLRNAVAVPDSAGRPMIAVVIDDLGLSRVNSKRVIGLPGPLTLAFLTYAEDLEDQTRAARAAGHELMVHVPMEPLSAELDSGPNTLQVGLSPEDLRRRLRWGLARFGGYVGVNNHMGSKFTGWEPGMSVVLEELRRRGLLFLDSRTVADSVAGPLADGIGVPYAGRDVFLDNEASAEAVRDQLAKAEAIARRRGFAIAIGHPRDGTIEALGAWLPTLAERGFVLVPVSAIVRRAAAVAG